MKKISCQLEAEQAGRLKEKLEAVTKQAFIQAVLLRSVFEQKLSFHTGGSVEVM